MSRVSEWDADDFLIEMLHPEWHRDANCRGMDPAIFFPERSENVQVAKAVCRGCPVSKECEDAGRRESQGIWDGRTFNERRAIRIAERVMS